MMHDLQIFVPSLGVCTTRHRESECTVRTMYSRQHKWKTNFRFLDFLAGNLNHNTNLIPKTVVIVIWLLETQFVIELPC